MIEWSWYVAADLFFGGLGAGAYLASVVADMWGKKRWEKFARLGAHLSWPLIAMGMVLLTLDLGRVDFRDPMHILNVYNNPFSIMTIGTVLLTIFLVVGVLTSFLWLAKQRQGRLKSLIEIIGAILAVGVAVYTGLLLAMARGNPLWGSPFLPWLFVLSASLTGLALLGLSETWLGQRLFPSFSSGEIAFLHVIGKACSTIIVAELVTLVLYIASVSATATREIEALLVGALSPLFLGVVVLLGLIIPLVLEKYGEIWLEKTGGTRLVPMMAMFGFVFMLIGGLFLRYTILIAGQL